MPCGNGRKKDSISGNFFARESLSAVSFVNRLIFLPAGNQNICKYIHRYYIYTHTPTYTIQYIHSRVLNVLYGYVGETVPCRIENLQSYLESKEPLANVNPNKIANSYRKTGKLIHPRYIHTYMQIHAQQEDSTPLGKKTIILKRKKKHQLIK